MATKKTKGLKLESLIGKQVKIQVRYSVPEEGPVTVLGIDHPLICVDIGGPVWWTLHDIEAIAEWREEMNESK